MQIVLDIPDELISRISIAMDKRIKKNGSESDHIKEVLIKYITSFVIDAEAREASKQASVDKKVQVKNDFKNVK